MSTETIDNPSPQVGDVFRSNGGVGPMSARVIEIIGDKILMERWTDGGIERSTFTLPRSFMASKSCGWTQVDAAAYPASGELDELVKRFQSGEFLGSSAQYRLIQLLIAERAKGKTT